MILPTIDDVESAAKRLAGRTFPTPLVRNDSIDNIIGAKVWFKPECTQKVGAFKYRGAYNRLVQLTEEERKVGVVAFSSGNHAQGVSRSAKELGIPAIIVMPSDAPTIKVEGVKRDGAQIIFYDRQTESREDIAAEISQNEGRIVVPSYDDLNVIAGQGTAGLEIAQESKALGFEFDQLITPLGGGGLCAGISLAMAKHSPGTEIFGAEPDGYNDHQLSLAAGAHRSISDPRETICDAILTPTPGELTFAINKNSLKGVFTVSDEDCLLAMGLAKKHLGLIVEPGGSVGLAALLAGKTEDFFGKTICVVLSGGNVDQEIMKRAEVVEFSTQYEC